MKVKFLCSECEIQSKKDLYDQSRSHVEIIAYDVNEEDIMENLNFEDVMNYYGVSKVGEWAEANR